MDMRQLKFGVEIETVGCTREHICKAIQLVVGGTIKHEGVPNNYDPWVVIDSQERTWRVVADGSLSAVPFNLRAEVVTPILTWEDLPTLQEVVRAVRRTGAKATTDCSIHVHVNGAAFDGRTLANLIKLVYKQESLIYAALQVQESRLNRYTKPIERKLIESIEKVKPKTREQMNRLWYGYFNQSPERMDQSRYHSVNLNSLFLRGSIEFRSFEGSLHAGRVKADVQLALALAARALTVRSTSAKRQNLDPVAAKYQFRVFLLHLGLIGPEFATARKHLLAALPGDSAFRHGRPIDKKKGKDKDGTYDQAESTPRPELS